MTAVEIRSLATHADFAACVDLQRETWGRDFADTVPASILMVSQKIGGVSAGAFDARGQLIGFVFGMTGLENGNVVHWSDMLAVRADAQNLGVGRRLKEFQRAEVARLGARVIYWTFDPLVARNAHLNFNVFGVRAVEYRRDMYGDETGSDLHRNIGTDRLIVAWPVSDGEIAERKRETSATRNDATWTDVPVIGDVEHPDHRWDRIVGQVEQLRIAVPLDISLLQGSEAARAASWRSSTRAAFESALRRGYHVAGFTTDGPRERGYYLLNRQP